MATTVTLTASNFCPAGNHFTLTATGDIAFSAVYAIDEFIADLTDEEKAVILKGLVRLAKVTRTAAQVKSGLLAGVTVAI
jgi:hypothetical protein